MDSLNCLNNEILSNQVKLWSTGSLIRNMLHNTNQFVRVACETEVNRRIPVPTTNERKDDGNPQVPSRN